MMITTSKAMNGGGVDLPGREYAVICLSKSKACEVSGIVRVPMKRSDPFYHGCI